MAQITIIGLGTLGGSLALALRRYTQAADGKAPPFTIVGCDPERSRQEIEQWVPGLDRLVGDYLAAVREAAFVILALPTWKMRDALGFIAPYLPAGATVTDTAANKRLVMQWAAEILPASVSFVGGHPLPHRIPAPALTQDNVIDEPPDADLFQAAPYCIMPLPSAREEAVNGVISLAEAVGAKPYFTDPLEHDSFQAAVHDLPVFASFALAHLLGNSPAWRDMGPLAGAAFRETTRLASTDPQAVRADLVANRDHLLDWIDRYQVALQELRDLVAGADPADLELGAGKNLGAALIAGRNTRTGWLNPKAKLTPMEQATHDSLQQARSSNIIRSFLGGFLTDRLTGRDKQ